MKRLILSPTALILKQIHSNILTFEDLTVVLLKIKVSSCCWTNEIRCYLSQFNLQIVYKGDSKKTKSPIKLLIQTSVLREDEIKKLIGRAI